MKKGSKQEQDKKKREEVPLRADIALKEKTEEFGARFWIIKTISMLVLLLAVTFFVQIYVDIEIMKYTVQAIFVALCFGFFHEFLHYHVARKLGYEVEWWRTALRMGFNIDSGDVDKKKWEKDNQSIAIMPYIYILPMALTIFVVGMILKEYGYAVGALATLLLHAYSYHREGEDVAE